LSGRTTIDLVVATNPDGTPFYESVLVEPRGERRYRVLASPGLLEGVAAGDEIELTDEEPGYRVLARGGNVCVQFHWDGDIQRCERELLPKIEALGGWIDGGTSRLIVFTIPASAGFPAIEAVFATVAADYPGCAWLYGNVYDPVDGTPLNWWT
jgi:hypothetical protein